MAWVFLILAGLLEVVWSAAMKQSDGFTRLVPSLVTLAGMLGSFGFLAFAMKALPLGTAYTIWTGIGAIGAFAVGIGFLGDELTTAQLAAASLIVAGVALMGLAES